MACFPPISCLTLPLGGGPVRISEFRQNFKWWREGLPYGEYFIILSQYHQ